MPDTDPKKFYLTTPIYYVNARPHIGHAYTTIVADVLARRHRLLGDDTFFLTGTDEHGQKIERSAAAAGVPPQQFADQVSSEFRKLWDRMGLTYDRYIRTTDPRHIQGAQKLFADLYARGQIYLSSYTGQYSIGEEMFVEGPPGTLGPDGRPTETVTEENFFFRLSDYQLPLLNLIESNQLLITPDSSRNEVLAFLRGNISTTTAPTQNLSSRPEAERSGDAAERPAGEPATTARTAAGTPYLPGALRDLSVSRSSFTWGIPVPDDILRAAGTTQKHVIYVWLDALANYMTAIGYGSDAPADEAEFKKYWPADLHLVGKEITRFHCVYWPAFLLALNPALLNSTSTTDAATPSAASTTPPNDAPTPSAASTTPPNEAVILSEASQSHREAQSKDPEEGSTTHTHHATLPTDTARQLSTEQHQTWATKMLPKQITAHGWLLFDNSKMSKSKGNIVRTETILDAFGALCPPVPEALCPPVPEIVKGTASAAPIEPSDNSALAAEVRPPTPHERDLFASDVLRYFLLREIPFGQDGSFSFDALITRYNADLANGYGNLVSRTLSMINQYLGGAIPEIPSENDVNIVTPGAEHIVQTSHLEDCSFGQHLTLLQALVLVTDRFLTSQAPWKQHPDVTDEFQMMLRKRTLGIATESIRIITALLHPILPFATARVWAQLGLGDIEEAARNGELTNLQWGGLKPGTKLGPLSPIFPRADKGLAQIMIDMENDRTSTPLTTENGQRTTPSTHPAAGPRTASIDETAATLPVAGSTALTTGPDPAPAHLKAPASAPYNSVASQTPITAEPSDASPQITIDDFAKIDLRVAQVLVAERIPKADKLLRLEVDLGYERRQILSGIAEWYAPEDLIGRRIVVITNLAPRKMRGLESHGMLLAASADEDGKPGKPILATMAEDIALGSRLK